MRYHTSQDYDGQDTREPSFCLLDMQVGRWVGLFSDIHLKSTAFATHPPGALFYLILPTLNNSHACGSCMRLLKQGKVPAGLYGSCSTLLSGREGKLSDGRHRPACTPYSFYCLFSFPSPRSWLPTSVHTRIHRRVACPHPCMEHFRINLSDFKSDSDMTIPIKIPAEAGLTRQSLDSL